MKKCFTIVVFFFCSWFTQAQQNEQYTQYMYNTLTINPAYAGSRDVLSAVLLHRTQWIGLEGAPQTSSFSMHTPIERKKIGLGFNILNDQLGALNETSVTANFSYTIDLDYFVKLSMGISAGAYLYSQDLSKLDLRYSDPFYTNNLENKLSPQVGFGFLLHSDKYYIGASIPRMLRTTNIDFENNSNYGLRERLHYYGTAGYVFNLSKMVKFKPAGMVKLVFGSPAQVDLSANFSYNDKFILGTSYSISSSVSALAGFQINDSWLLGMSYDVATSLPDGYNNGSFEFFLRFELFKRYNKMMTPRFF